MERNMWEFSLNPKFHALHDQNERNCKMSVI